MGKKLLNRRELLSLSVVGGLNAFRGGQPLLAAPMQRQRIEAKDLAESRRPEMTDLLSRLIAIPSVVGDDAGEAQELVASYLIDSGYRANLATDDPLDYEQDPEFMPPGEANGLAVNLIAEPSTTNRASRIALFAHIDTEVAHPGWTTDPLIPLVDGSRLTGLGAADDKGGVAAMCVAAAILADTGGPAPTVMSLHGKGGGSRGSLPAFRRRRNLSNVLYLHPAETGRGLDDIKHKVQGALDLVLTVHGWRGRPLEIGGPDSAPYHEGGDALETCILALEGLKKTLLRNAEVNVGRMEAGDRVGSVPEQATAELRILFEEPDTADGLLSAIREQLHHLGEALASDKGRFVFDLRVGRLKTNPATVSWEDPSCLALRDAITRIKGKPPSAHTRHYAGDIRYPIRLAGAPAFGAGSLGGNFYGPNEWVDLDDLVNLVAVTVLTVEAWARISNQ